MVVGAIEVGGRRRLLVHALGDPARLDRAARRHLERLGIDAGCVGRSRRALVTREGVLSVNPRGWGRTRFAFPRSVGRLGRSGERRAACAVRLDPS